jgi:hypothetical protein
VKVFWFHLRTSGQRWFVLPMAILGIAVMFLRSQHWIGNWPESGAAAQLTAFFMSTLAAGTSAWAAASLRRQRLVEQLSASAIHPATLEAYRLSSSVTLLLTPYLACQAIAFALTAPSFPPGITMWVAYSVMGAVVMLMSCAWGWLIGRYLSSTFAAFVAFLSWTLFTATMSQKFELTAVDGPPWLNPNGLSLTARMIAVLALLGALAWALPNIKRPGAVLAVSGGLAVVAVSVVALDGITTRQRPDSLVCDQGAITLCLWPEHEGYLSTVANLNSRVAAIPSIFTLPEKMYEYGINDVIIQQGNDIFVSDGPEPNVSSFSLPEGSIWGMASDVSSAIVSANLTGCDLSTLPEDDFRAYSVQAFLEVYLAGGGKPDYTAVGPVEMERAWNLGSAATELTDAERFTWALTTLNQYRSDNCR